MRDYLSTVTIDKRGKMVLSRSTMFQFGFSKHKYLRMYYDKERHMLALEPFDGVDIAAVKMNKTGTVTLKGFCLFFHLNIDDLVGKYLVGKDSITPAFVSIDLNKKIPLSHPELDKGDK